MFDWFIKLRTYLLISGFILVILGIFRLFDVNDKNNFILVNDLEQENLVKMYLVDISGAIKLPGVYTINSKTRLGDLLEIAGGLKENVNMDEFNKKINRSKYLYDGEKIYIPFSGEFLESSQLININTSSKLQIESLPGIGSVMADKIIEGRPYSKNEELLTKSILTRKVYDKIKDYIIF